jgi:hypothetical protein
LDSPRLKIVVVVGRRRRAGRRPCLLSLGRRADGLRQLRECRAAHEAPNPHHRHTHQQKLTHSINRSSLRSPRGRQRRTPVKTDLFSGGASYVELIEGKTFCLGDRMGRPQTRGSGSGLEIT